MQKYTLALVVVALCAPMLLANRENRGNRENRQSQKQAMRACNYEWSECRVTDGATCGNGKKTGTSDNAECPRREVEKRCKVRCETAEGGAEGGASARKSRCRYRSSKDGSVAAAPCDSQTNTQAVVQTLVSGDPATCQQTVTVQKPCRRQNRRVPRATGLEDEDEGGDARCKYRRGQKGECNPTTKKRTITMTLKRKSPAGCPATKTVEKPCKIKAPKPDKAERRQQKAGGRPNRRRQSQDQ